MFDAAYFQDRLPQDIRDKRHAARGHEPSVKVHLHGGDTYSVARMVEVGSGWVVFDAYAKKKHRAEKTVKDEALDRVAFAYNAISHVTIALKPLRGAVFKTLEDAVQ
jgi:hypothetical protein